MGGSLCSSARGTIGLVQEGSSQQTLEHWKGGNGMGTTRRGPGCACACLWCSLVYACSMEQEGIVGKGKQFTCIEE